MTIEKEKIEELANAVEALSAEKKELGDEINDVFDSFSKEHKIEKKVLKRAIKDLLAYRKNKDEFITNDLETSQLLVMVIEEFQD